MASKDMSRICIALLFGQAPVIGTGSSDLVYIYGLRHVLTQLYASVYLSTFPLSRELVKYRCKLHMDNYYTVLIVWSGGFVHADVEMEVDRASIQRVDMTDRMPIPISNLLNHILH